VSFDEAVARIKNQMSLEEKIKYADFILDNNMQQEDLLQKVQELYPKLLSISKKLDNSIS
ncbi:MAG: dephospho-CoA kinase, partial [Nitrospinaceae bacterium]|nr:dephospho-CoA kinase [Nitrospinaceae bacterium]